MMVPLPHALAAASAGAAPRPSQGCQIAAVSLGTARLHTQCQCTTIILATRLIISLRETNNFAVCRTY